MKKLLILVAALVIFTTPALALGIRDQGQIFNTGGELALGAEEWSQSITTGISGKLTEIQIQFHYGVPENPPALNLSIFDGGNPISGTALFTEQIFITSTDLDDDNQFTWDLGSADLIFNSEEVFSFVLQADGVGYHIAGNDPPGYIGGELFKNGASFSELSDIGFITYVQHITVPTTITVNSLEDPGDGVCNVTECTLREAIAAASGGDTIDFSVSGTIILASGQLTLTIDLVLAGPGASQLIIDANQESRIFEIKPGAEVTISGVTVSGGSADGEDGGNYFDSTGGGIFNEGILTLIDSIVTGNSSTQAGGGIYERGGPTMILRSTISYNTAGGCCGGGICDSSESKMTIVGCTIAYNSVVRDSMTHGGGIFNDAQDNNVMDIINTTITGNFAGEAGGIAIDSGPVTITNSTISGNIASHQGGGIGYCCDVILVNTILAMNTAPIGPDCGIFQATSLGNNIIGDLTDCPIEPLPTDIIGDPGLGAFFDHGAPGQGHIPLLPYSPAIDSGDDNICPPTDQLGTLRPQDGDGDGNAISDIGAYEFVLTYVEVEIDIKPGGFPNSINLKSKGKVPVAVLTTDGFDAYHVDPGSCEFAGAYPLRWKMEDVDHDGDYDMLFHFMTRELDLTKTSTEATLVGETVYGDQITATDSVNIVPKGNMHSKKAKKKKK